MRATEVFTPGKLPEVTYVDTHLASRVTQLNDALDTGAAVISLSGPSKSGKTVFVEKSIGKDRLIQVTGAGVTHAGKLWDRVFDLIGTPIPKTHTASRSFDGSTSGKVGGTVGVFLQGKGEVAVSGAWSRGSSEQHDLSTDHLQLLIRELQGTNLVIFVDDFHYIPKDVQVEVANQIKEAIRSNVIFVVASVPYHSDDAIRANSDLRGRSIKLDFDYWKPEQLKSIATKGFSALNLVVDDAFVAGLAAEAAGSPQLMQSLCLTTCFEAGVRERLPHPKSIDADKALLQRVCSRTAATSDYSSTVAKLREGPKTRGQDRKSYILGDNSTTDVYPLILRAVALDPPELTLRYANLQKRISSLCKGEQPSGSSVTGACLHIASIANESENRSIVEWDGENDVLDIRDPYLLFFLRWSD